MCRLQGFIYRKAGCSPQVLPTRSQLPLGQGLLTLSMAHPVCHVLIFLYVHKLCVQGGVSGKEDSAVPRRAAAGLAGTALSCCSGQTHKQHQAALLASGSAGP